jgi:hypothetical protein
VILKSIWVDLEWVSEEAMEEDIIEDIGKNKKEVKIMPRKDRTGPEGRGPMTGRGLGPCGKGIGRSSGQRFTK